MWLKELLSAEDCGLAARKQPLHLHLEASHTVVVGGHTGPQQGVRAEQQPTVPPGGHLRLYLLKPLTTKLMERAISQARNLRC